MGLFDKVGSVKSSADANYYQPGIYYSIIERIKADKTRAGKDFVAIETKVLASLTQEKDESGRVVSQKVGETPTHLIMMDQDMALPNIKSMVMAITGCSEDEVTAEACDAMVGPQQPFANLVVEIHARQIVTRKGTPFTKIVYKGMVSSDDLEAAGVTELPDGAVIADTMAD